ncbi:hypothetical protein H6P81_007506 [Aristolochia fimbriata]|uniref:Protein kinase domain-containing protein n=1 Tax=Aristolochia fimbriata TaxID=158543 RepID=A0AAV7F3U6_ARIFI|nr:hypothetical protein H6P81_007506 [Aristolochia fimbriata]
MRRPCRRTESTDIAFSAMFIFKIFLTTILFRCARADDSTDFVYNGFRDADLILGNLATVTRNGLLRLTNYTQMQKGRAFYRPPLHFKSSSNRNATLSFSTTYVFAIVPENPNFQGHGFAFVVSPSVVLPGSLPAQFFGVFNSSNNGESSNHVFAIEHDTGKDSGFGDVDGNHIGIDVNGLVSLTAAPAAYFTDDGRWHNFSLSSGIPFQAWIEYDGVSKRIAVTVAPVTVPKPRRPLLSASLDLAPVLLDPMYIGFSSATSQLVASHYILGWSFKMNGQAPALDLSSLPRLPRTTPKPRPKILTIGLPIILVSLVLAVVSAAVIVVRRRIKYSEGVASGLLYLHEEWEQMVLHRDVKASNVLLDGGLNGKLGDFGLARLYDHGAGPRTTHIVGTIGYMAPELAETSKASPSSDVFAFGVFLLEVATGKRPVEASTVSGEELVLTEWVFSCWKRGLILETSDPKLGGDHRAEEMELVLKLGLLCSHPVAGARPSMTQVLQILNGDAPLTETVAWSILESTEHYHSSTTPPHSSSTEYGFSQTASVVESLLSGGR